jgi:hypothetical protein
MPVREVLTTSVADPHSGSGAFLAPGSGMETRQIWDAGSGINIPDHISESLASVFCSFPDPRPSSTDPDPRIRTFD